MNHARVLNYKKGKKFVCLCSFFISIQNRDKSSPSLTVHAQFHAKLRFTLLVHHPVARVLWLDSLLLCIEQHIVLGKWCKDIALKGVFYATPFFYRLSFSLTHSLSRSFTFSSACIDHTHIQMPNVFLKFSFLLLVDAQRCTENQNKWI